MTRNLLIMNAGILVSAMAIELGSLWLSIGAIVFIALTLK